MLNKVEEASSYKFINFRIKEDKKYRGLYLGSTKSDGTVIEPCDSIGEIAEGDIEMTDETTMNGEISMVSKKIGLTEGVSQIFCMNCDADVKVSKCPRSRTVKLEFEEDVTEKLHTFSIFSNVIDKVLNLKSAEIPQPELRSKLLSLPKVVICHSKNIIQSIKVLE